MPDPLVSPEDLLPPDDPRKRPLALNIPSLLGGLASFPRGTPPPPVATPDQAPIADMFRGQSSGNLAADAGMMGAPKQPTPPPQQPQGPLADFMQKTQQPQLGGWKKALDIAGQVLAPNLESRIPGTEGNYQRQRGLAVRGQTEYDTAQQSQAKTVQEQALAEQERAKADSLRNPKPEKDQDVVHAYSNALASGDTAEAERLKPLVQQYMDVTDKSKPPVEKPGEYKPYTVAGSKEPVLASQVGSKLMTRDGKELPSGAVPFEKPAAEQKMPQQLVGVPQPDGSTKLVDAKPGMTLPKGSQTVSEFGKSAGPTADEQRRADIAGNLNENLGKLEEIASRRPDLFGPIAGRMTQAKGYIGTSDPDVATLQTIKEQIGIAQISAHGMRSGAQIEAAAQSILNGFKNSAEAVKSSAKAARKSVATFTADVESKGGSTGTTKKDSEAPTRPKGVPSNAVWNAQDRTWRLPQ